MNRRNFVGGLAATLILAACAESRTKESTGQYIDDASITSKVKTALTRDPGTSAFDISVETYKGTVQLSGFVDTDAEKRRAEQVAEGVSGVRSVRNDLRVKAR